MGANAQIEVPAFTAGQVLTAAEMTQINTGIPVFATTVTRDAAFGGAGEKALAQGQMAFIEATNSTQYYNGSAWLNIGPSGLVLLKAETAFTTATSVTADSIFTSAYTNYFMTVRYQTTSSAGGIRFKVRAGGTSVSTGYNQIVNNGYVSSNTITTTSSTTSLQIADNTNSGGFAYTTVNISGIALAEATVVTALNSSNFGAFTSPQSNFIASNHSTATAYDGMELLVGAGTMTGSYTIYGYQKAL
jgi:hypothetical protein